MKKMLRSVAALSLAGCMMSANVLAATTFSDVPGHWGASYINRAVEEGLVSGMGDGTYGVDKTLSAAQFTTMICNLFYKSDVTAYSTQYASQLSGQPWWYSYMSVAYEKGLLANTVVGNYRKNYTAWPKDLVEGEVSRYDMAQILINVVDAQQWQAASAWDVLSAQTQIKDWSTIPQQYQSAVANAYARGFLSGMGDGSFSGASAMTRAQGAVVLCKLLDAQTKEKENVYTNTTNLVNGKAPTQSNVKSAVAALKASYPKNMVWNGTNTYTSGVLGAAYGCDAYSYTISDKVFGNLKVSKVSDFEDMKPGDLLYLNSLKCHVVITNVTGDEFDYTYCTTSGLISWSGSGDIDDLTSKDILYTRYTDDTADKDTVLNNGKKATESNVEDLIDQFLDDEYDYGDEWDETYKTDSFSTTSKTYKEDQAFAYYLSDYIFGELESEEVDDFDDLRIGDVLYVDDMYVVVTDISGDTIYCIGVDADDDKVSKYKMDVDNLDYKTDSAYTRYPSSNTSDDDDDDDNNDGLLSNGKNVTTSNVRDLIEEFLDDEYEVGDEWDKTSYTSDVFGKGTDDEGFAYYLSDYIFDDDDDLDYEEVDDFTDLRPGDVIYSDELYAGWYGVVTRISSSTITYLGVDDDDEIYQTTISLGKLDKAYTRYPIEKSDDDGKLSNGKIVTASNVKALIEEFLENGYDEGEEWDKTSYTSEVFGKGTGEAGFAFYLSDYIFGDDDDLDYCEVEDFTDLRPGDIIYSASLKYGDYGVVTTISSTNITYLGVDDDDEIYKATIKISKLSTTDDEAYTRYPVEDDETLSNGKSVTTTNVKALLKAFLSDEYTVGDEWDKTSYTSEVFGKGTGEAGFAYYLSDYVFGDDDDLDYEVVTDVDDLRVGDVIYCQSLEDGYYAVIYAIDDDEITYLGVDDDDEIYKDILDADDWDEDEDEGYTRYPS